MSISFFFKLGFNFAFLSYFKKIIFYITQWDIHMCSEANEVWEIDTLS